MLHRKRQSQPAVASHELSGRLGITVGYFFFSASHRPRLITRPQKGQ